MSMIHTLTLGFLDPVELQKRQARGVRPLPSELRRLLAAHADRGTSSVGGHEVICTETFLQVRWCSPGRNAAAERFARAALEQFPGLIAADVDHARLVEKEELRG